VGKLTGLFLFEGIGMADDEMTQVEKECHAELRRYLLSAGPQGVKLLTVLCKAISAGLYGATEDPVLMSAPELQQFAKAKFHVVLPVLLAGLPQRVNLGRKWCQAAILLWGTLPETHDEKLRDIAEGFGVSLKGTSGIVNRAAAVAAGADARAISLKAQIILHLIGGYDG
jgi:hypothetical protein